MRYDLEHVLQNSFDRYINDCFIVCNNIDVSNQFLEKANKISYHTRFTQEDMKNNKLLFLDISS